MSDREGSPVATPGWPAEAADRVEAIVTGVRDRTVGPLTTAARAVVFGILVGVLSQVALVLVAVAIVRILDTYAFSGRIWASYSVVGGIFLALGSLLWLKRRPKKG